MLSHDDNKLTFYPAYCFSHSPTCNTWARLTIADVLLLREKPGFEGQDIFFHLNHPIKWVRLVGVIVAYDLLPTRFIFGLDDSSGAIIDITCERPKPLQPIDVAGTTASENQPAALPEVPTKGITPSGRDIELAGIDLGAVVKVKGIIGAFRGARQLLLERIAIIRSTNEEAAAWTENTLFHHEILSKPWILGEKEQKRAKRKALGSERQEKLRKLKYTDAEQKGQERQQMLLAVERKRKEIDNLRETERRQRKEELAFRLQTREKKQEVERQRLEEKAAQQLLTAKLEKDRKEAETEKQHALEVQQRIDDREMLARERVKRAREADRAERERIFAEQKSAKNDSNHGEVQTVRKQSRKERRTHHF